MNKIQPFFYSAVLMGCGIALLVFINGNAVPKLLNEELQKSSNVSYDTITVRDTVLMQKSDSTIAHVYFRNGSANLENSQEVKLQSILQSTKPFDDEVFILDGYADTFGTSSYNDKISSERAFSVFNVLVKNGVKKEDIFMRSFGTPSYRESITDSIRRVDITLSRDFVQ
jgi:outer membrane protein OmpA-like peptidoglycan-associated protein